MLKKYDRSWLVYSKGLDGIFYFCCKLFKKYSQKHNRIINEGFNDWIIPLVRLKEHENSVENVNNMSVRINLCNTIETNKTTNKDLKEHIKKKTQH